MEHPFSTVAFELKALTHKLNACTYQAVFGRSIAERQQGSTAAVAIHEQLERVFTRTYEAAGRVADFMHGPASGGLQDSVESFIRLVEGDSAFSEQMSPETKDAR